MANAWGYRTVRQGPCRTFQRLVQALEGLGVAVNAIDVGELCPQLGECSSSTPPLLSRLSVLGVDAP